MNKNPAQSVEAEVVGPTKASSLHMAETVEDMSLPESKINYKEARFIMEYLTSLNACDAVVKAGYTENRDSAKCIGHDLLRKLKIKKAIQAQMNARAQRTLITADVILRELFLIASVNPKDAFDKHGKLKDIRDMPDSVTRALGGFDVEDTYFGIGGNREKTSTIKKVKFLCKNKALETIARHLGLLTDRLELSATGMAPLQAPVIKEVFVESTEAAKQITEINGQ